MRHARHRLLGTLIFAVAVVSGGGCGADGDSPAGATPSLAVRPDPGPPADLHGPKCTTEIAGATLPECISAVVQPVGELTQLFLNFCVANGQDRCAGAAPVYVSLLLPMTSWAPGRLDQAVGGRVEVKLADGRRYLLDGSRGAALPLQLTVREQPNGDLGHTLFGELEMSVPPADGQGAPLVLRARIN